MSNTFSTQLTQQRITDADGREFRFRGDLYSQESTFPLVVVVVVSAFLCRYEPVRRTGKSDDWLTIFLLA